MASEAWVAILPAAGRSRRFGRNKLMEDLRGRAVLLRSLDAFLRRGDVAAVVVAVDSITGPWLEQQNIRDPRLRLCPGGEHRAESVLNAVQSSPAECQFVAVHDAARPLVSQELIDRALAAARAHGAAVPAMPVNLTIKEARGPLPAKVERTVPRQTLWAMQTPQIMRRADLLAAFAHCPLPLDQITDDAQLLELSGKPVWLVDGEERNLKITTPLDLKLAEMLLDSRL